MLRHIYIVFISTFIFGFITGTLIFLFNNTGSEGDGSIEANAKGMLITAKAYGGCMQVGCPSYKIENNGAYMFLRRDVNGQELRYEDKLTSRQLQVLKDRLADTDFDEIDDSEFTGTCPITYDGLAYEYGIEYRGERYEIDTCIESVEDEALFEILGEYFSVFELLYANE